MFIELLNLLRFFNYSRGVLDVNVLFFALNNNLRNAQTLKKAFLQAVIMSIKAIDFNDFQNPSYQQRFVSGLGNSLKETGFVVVQNLGINKTIDSLRRQSRLFFEILTDEEKFACYNPTTKGERGYVPFGEETAIGYKSPDVKEFFGVGRDAKEYHQNLWPEEKILPDFKQTILDSYFLLESRAHEIISAIGLHLSIDPDDLINETIEGNSVLRLNYYPGKQKGNANPHKDSNYITLLHNPGPGLHVLINNYWTSVDSEGGTVINIGEKLEKRTGLPATWHYAKVESQGARLNEPFFLQPRNDVLLQPCLTSEEFMRTHLSERYTGPKI